MCCVGVLDGAGSAGEAPPLPHMSSPDCVSASVQTPPPPAEPSASTQLLTGLRGNAGGEQAKRTPGTSVQDGENRANVPVATAV